MLRELMRSVGCPPTEDLWREAGSLLPAPLPSPYRDFLCEVNGGVFEVGLDVVHRRGEAGEDGGAEVLATIKGLGGLRSEPDELSLVAHWSSGGRRRAPRRIWVGWGVFGEPLLLDLYTGDVYLDDSVIRDPSWPDEDLHLASSWGEFVAKLGANFDE